MKPHMVNTKLASFLYQLMRDHVPPGVVERVLQDSQESTAECSNGHLAKYAEGVAEWLQGTTTTPAVSAEECRLAGGGLCVVCLRNPPPNQVTHFQGGMIAIDFALTDAERKALTANIDRIP